MIYVTFVEAQGEFARQITFLSRAVCKDKSRYFMCHILIDIIETIVLRLNYLALIGYNESLCHECRECYADGEEGEQEWQEYKARQTEKRKAWEDSIKDSLGIRNSAGSFHITQSELEVFTVVHVREAGKGKGNASGEGN